jgi:hypothetical protein
MFSGDGAITKVGLKVRVVTKEIGKKRTITEAVAGLERKIEVYMDVALSCATLTMMGDVDAGSNEEEWRRSWSRQTAGTVNVGQDNSRAENFEYPGR